MVSEDHLTAAGAVSASALCWNDSHLPSRYLSPWFSVQTQHVQTLISEFLDLPLHQYIFLLCYSLMKLFIVVLRMVDSWQCPCWPYFHLASYISALPSQTHPVLAKSTCFSKLSSYTQKFPFPKFFIRSIFNVLQIYEIGPSPHFLRSSQSHLLGMKILTNQFLIN